MDVTPDILMLAGPTASGKSALSLHAARVLNAEIINADSMQIYDGLRIITARPDATEMEEAPHHLFGVIDPSERCSVGRWTRMVFEVLDTLKARRSRAILVGGTGLYYKALTRGLAPIPDMPGVIMTEVTALYERGGVQALMAEALRLDPVAVTRIGVGDRQRLMRVIAVNRATGKLLSELQADTRPLIAPERVVGVVIQPDRRALYSRIETRFDAMMNQGVLEEVRAIRERALAPDLPAMKAVGLPPLIKYLRGQLNLDDAVAMAKRHSRRYAKRQFTWFSNQHPDWALIETLDLVEARGALDTIIATSFFGT